MTTVFANNQAMTAYNAVDSVIYSDPVSMGDADRATINWNVHYLWAYDGGGGGATGTASYIAQVSNDGAYWVDVTAATDSATAATGSTPKQIVALCRGEFIRFKMTLAVTAGDLAGVAFDLHVKLDHA